MEGETHRKAPRRPSAPETKFEDDMARLEEIVSEMESGALPLDDLIKRFEEGRALAARCSARLEEARARIDKVLADGSQAPLELEDKP